MLKEKVKGFLSAIVTKSLKDYNSSHSDLEYVFAKYVNHAVPTATNFDFNKFKQSVINYIKSQQIDTFNFKFSDSVTEPSIYNLIYAILTYKLLNERLWCSDQELLDYLNAFQREDGLFSDKYLENCEYKDYDWFGIRHLLPHILIAYRYLDSCPKYELSFLKPFYDEKYLLDYLNNINFNIPNDHDNKTFNLGVSLQFQRDYFKDTEAAKALDIIYNFLEKRINPLTGSWGKIDISDKNEYSRTQQIAYHLLVLWLYDSRSIADEEKLIDLCLNNQTPFGSFYNAGFIGSACTDIDCIFLINKLSKSTNFKKTEIQTALKKSLYWVLANQNEDGGFVFVRNQSLTYGEKELSSRKNESNMFATWFRTLSMAYLCDSLNIKNDFNIGRCPGYQF